MLDILLGPGKRRKAQNVLTSRINEGAVAALTSDRAPERSPFCKPVFLIPAEGRSWNPAAAHVVVSRDIAPGGLSIVHTEELGDRVLIGLPGKNDTKFLRCSIQHSTDIGYGFFQIGLLAEQIDDLDGSEVRALERRIESLTKDHAEVAE